MKKSKAQSISEYIMVISIVSAALVAMNVYFKRAVQAVVKVSADEIGSQSGGLTESDYEVDASGHSLLRYSHFASEWNKEETNQRLAGGNYSNEVIADQTINYGGNKWQGQRDMSTLERMKYKRPSSADSQDTSKQRGY